MQGGATLHHQLLYLVALATLVGISGCTSAGSTAATPTPDTVARATLAIQPATSPPAAAISQPPTQIASAPAASASPVAGPVATVAGSPAPVISASPMLASEPPRIVTPQGVFQIMRIEAMFTGGTNQPAMVNGRRVVRIVLDDGMDNPRDPASQATRSSVLTWFCQNVPLRTELDSQVTCEPFTITLIPRGLGQYVHVTSGAREMHFVLPGQGSVAMAIANAEASPGPTASPSPSPSATVLGRASGAGIEVTLHQARLAKTLTGGQGAQSRTHTPGYGGLFLVLQVELQAVASVGGNYPRTGYELAGIA
jgi:hypothetical protein